MSRLFDRRVVLQAMGMATLLGCMKLDADRDGTDETATRPMIAPRIISHQDSKYVQDEE